jgi:hypothetical protein
MQRNDPPKLHFAYAPTEPDLSAVDVKRVVPASLLGDPAALTVIGESHYVGVPALSFHEVCSCRPTAGETADVTAVVALERGVERSVSFETDRVRAGTRVEVRPLDAFPGAEGADAAFRFGPEAWTTISLGGGVAPDESDATDSAETPAAYETYHTYPEYDLAVYTETTLSRSGESRTTTDEPQT